MFIPPLLRISETSQAEHARSESAGQPIENLDLSDLLVALTTTGKSQQRLKRIRRVVRRSACEADGVERSKDEVAQQTGIRFRRQNACTLGIRDKLGPPGT